MNEEIIEKIKELIDQKEYLKASEICYQEQYKNDDKIQFELVKILRKMQNYDEALKICNRFPNNDKIQSQKIKVLIITQEYEKSLIECDRFPTNTIIQSQKITVLIKLDKLQDALNICNQFLTSEIIQSQKITILIKLDKLQEALNICNQFLHCEIIQLQKINILIKLNKLQEALEICDNFSNNEIIQYKKIIIKNLIVSGKLNQNNSLEKKLMKIYTNTMRETIIRNSLLDNYNKNILLVAYFEKHDKKQAIEILKKLKCETKEINKLRALNELQKKLSNNKKMPFDLTLYFNLINNTFEIQKKETQKEIKKETQKEIKKETKEKKILNEKGVDLVMKKEKKVIFIKGEKSKRKENKKLETNNLIKDILIKDVFKQEIYEIGKYIYCQMESQERRKSAIQAWDKLEDLSYCSISNKEAVKKMIHLIQVHSAYSNSVTLDEKKYVKYL